MNYKFYLPLVAFSALAFSSCKQKAEESPKSIVVYDVNNIDTTFTPGNNFFAFATNGWSKNNPLTDEYSRYGSFDKLADTNQEQIKELIENLAADTYPEGSLEQKIGTLFVQAMDSVKLNEQGVSPIHPQLEAINNIKTREDVIKGMVDVSVYASTPFLGIYVSADEKDSDNNLVGLYATGLGLGEREYYLAKDSISESLRKGYVDLIEKQFVNIGYDAKDAATVAKNILAIETALAKSFPTKESRRDPLLNYNKIKVSDLNKVANFNWTAFFDAYKPYGATASFEDINVGQTQGIVEAVRLINTLPIDQIKQYFTWKVVSSAAPYLSDNLYATHFDFYGKQMQGRKAMQPRWKRAVSSVEDGLGQALGKLYVEKYFPPMAKERMLELVNNLQSALGQRIDNLAWMGDQTKEKAHEKLNTFHVKIGYPDKWKDYSSLKIDSLNYWSNMVNIGLFAINNNLSKIGKPVDKDEWLMDPQMVNAYYNPTTNEICFPAGILQPPFFYLDGDDAVNYGGIGVVIGHEMSHGFDDQGSQYDKDGNINNWWTAEDKAAFDDRTKVLVEHFNGIEVLPGLFANGQYTLGENIGDFGGLQVAYTAFQNTKEAKENVKIDGYTPAQRFFLAYAGLWAGNMRDAEARRLTLQDVHSLAKWRVNGTLPHIDAWYEAWNIQEGDSLYIPKQKRADIW